MSSNSLSHTSVSKDAGSVNSSITAKSARVEELERLLTQARDEINLLKNQITVSSSVTRHGNNTFSAMVRKRKKPKEEKTQVGELRNVLKGIMNEHVFPREKFQSMENLCTLGTNSLGHFIMGKMNPPLNNPNEYWQGAWFIVKELFQEHRQAVAASLKKNFLKGMMKIEILL